MSWRRNDDLFYIPLGHQTKKETPINYQLKMFFEAKKLDRRSKKRKGTPKF